MISVLIPTFNSEKYIKEALESVFSQTYQNFEVIVVDDGSTDDTSEIISSFPTVQYFFQKHLGVAAARNSALKKARGEWIAFLDADDRWDCRKNQLQIDYLEAHPNCRILFSGVENFCDIPVENQTERQRQLLNAEMHQYIPSALIDRNLFKEIGLFNTECVFGEDTEWIITASLMGVDTSWNLPDVLYQRRIHTDNLSATHQSIGKNDILAIKAKLIRKIKCQK